jgi:DNA-binding NarL/FixJ family response regulator
MTKHTIVIIEDHAVFGHALRSLLSTKAELNIVGVFQSAEEALEELPKLNAELALIDVSLPGMTGLELLGEMQSKFPKLNCLMLSGHITSTYVKRALDSGARGYILKDDVTGIVEGIQEVLKGEVYLSHAIRDHYDTYG